MMSSEFWKRQVRAAVERHCLSPKIAVMGIGHELRGDDAAGIAVARALSGRGNFLVIEAGSAPENYTHQLRRFQPDLVLLIDAAQMNIKPGEIRVCELDSIVGFSASTHTTPLSVFAQYISAELKCEVLLVGIQPRYRAVGAPLSPEMQHAVRNICQLLLATFKNI